MHFSEIDPFVRFVRYLDVEEDHTFAQNLPVDARLFYVVHGTGRFEVGEESITLAQGGVLYLPAGTVYRIISSKVRYLAVNFDFTRQHAHMEAPLFPIRIEPGKAAEPIERAWFDDHPLMNGPVVVTGAVRMLPVLEEMESEYGMKLAYYREKLAVMLRTLLWELLRHVDEPGQLRERFRYEAVVDYVHRHCQEPLDNRRLAEHFHLHPNYLSAEFKRCTGMSLHKYVLQARIDKAAAYLEAGSRSIVEVAALVGFEDSNYFSRYFKKVMGVSPTEFGK